MYIYVCIFISYNASGGALSIPEVCAGQHTQICEATLMDQTGFSSKIYVPAFYFFPLYSILLYIPRYSSVFLYIFYISLYSTIFLYIPLYFSISLYIPLFDG